MKRNQKLADISAKIPLDLKARLVAEAEKLQTSESSILRRLLDINLPKKNCKKIQIY